MIKIIEKKWFQLTATCVVFVLNIFYNIVRMQNCISRLSLENVFVMEGEKPLPSETIVTWFVFLLILTILLTILFVTLLISISQKKDNKIYNNEKYNKRKWFKLSFGTIVFLWNIGYYLLDAINMVRVFIFEDKNGQNNFIFSIQMLIIATITIPTITYYVFLMLKIYKNGKESKEKLKG